VNQKLSDWANLAEIVSGVAIVVTLVFVIVEIRENTEAIRSSNRQSLASRGEQHMLARTESPELAQIVEKATSGQMLSVAERWIYRGYLGAIVRLTEEAYLQFEEGRLDEAYWLRNARAFPAYFGNLEARDTFAFWDSVGVLTPGFSVWATAEITEMWGDAGSADSPRRISVPGWSPEPQESLRQ